VADLRSQRAGKPKAAKTAGASIGVKYMSPDEACAWLTDRTSRAWSLQHLLTAGLRPLLWLDYSASAPAEVFCGRVEGFLAQMCFQGDVQRLEAGADEALLTMTFSPEGKVLKFVPGLRAPLTELRFKAVEVARLGAPKGGLRQESGRKWGEEDLERMRNRRATGVSETENASEEGISRQRLGQLIGTPTQVRQRRAQSS
jgi:hypothetical protein